MLENIFVKNCCDGLYNSLDVHFTSACDNKCAHCIDMRFSGINVNKPDIDAICKTVIEHSHKYDDILFLGGEPCLYLEELLECVRMIKQKTNLKQFVTTSVPKTCFDKYSTFEKLINELDGLNISVQHYEEKIADSIRGVTSKYDRQKFYKILPNKNKIRVNLNIVKPFLFKKEDISNCLIYYDKMNFNSIKISEIQHGKDQYVSFEEIFKFKLKSPFFGGCQTYIRQQGELPKIKTPLLLKRSCFMCEETLKASLFDGTKVLYKLFTKPKNNYNVIYSNGKIEKGWI